MSALVDLLSDHAPAGTLERFEESLADANFVGQLSRELGHLVEAEAPAAAARLLVLADALFRARLFSVAGLAYATARKRAASTDEKFHAEFKLGQLARREGDRHSAITLFESAAETRASHPGLIVELASTYLELGMTHAAGELLETQRLPDHLRHLQGRLQGLHAKAVRNFAMAASHFAAALRVAPDDVDLRIELISSLLAAGKLNAARSEAVDFTTKSPTSEVAWRLRGKACFAVGDIAAANAAFATAAACDPKRWEPLVELASVFLKAGNLPEARRTAESACRVALNVEGPRRLLGEIIRESGDVAAYEAHLARMVADFPNAGVPLVELALLNKTSGNLVLAAQMLATDTKCIATNSDAMVRLAISALQDGCAAVARRILERAATLAPDSPAIRVALAQATFELGHTDASIAILQDGENSGAPELALKAVEILLKQGKYHAALARLTSPNLPLSARTKLMLVEIHLSAGNLEAARALMADVDVAATDDKIRQALLSSRLDESLGRDCDSFARLSELDDVSRKRPGVATEQLRLAIKIGRFNEAQSLLNHLKSINITTLGRENYRTSRGRPWDLLKEIVDEWTLDPELVKSLNDVLGAPETTQFEQLRALVRQQSAHTIPALQFLRLATHRTVVVPAEHVKLSKIPKRIFQYWDQLPTPDDLAHYISTIIDENPGCEHILLDRSSAEELLRTHAPIDVQTAFTRATELAQKADLLRLALLAYLGGWYVDVDSRGLAALSTLDDFGSDMVVYRDQLSAIANDVLGARSGHPAIEAALQSAADAVNRGDRDCVWLSTGPGCLARAVATYSAASWPLANTDIRIHELGTVRSVVASHCVASYKLTNAHWSRQSSRSIGTLPIEQWWLSVAAAVTSRKAS